MKRFLWISMLALAGVVSACAGGDDPDEGGQSAYASASEALQQQDEALKINPCALVRCRAGTQCEVQDGHAVCVPMPTPAPECLSDKECRTFSNYCGGCSCQALDDGEVDPVCKGDIVACLIDPCMNSKAACVRGQCVLSGGAASF